MFAAFQNIRTVTKTRTNIRLFLDDPALKDGKFTKYVSAILEGTMEVFTGPQAYTVWDDTGPLYVLPWYVGDMPSAGDSNAGAITMTGNPGLQTTGIIKQNVAGQPYPATLQASVFQTLNVPGYGPLHNKFPVVVQGTVDAIPPYHTDAACLCALLYDDTNTPRGMVGGRSLTLLGPA
jgi:hypothetical protein